MRLARGGRDHISLAEADTGSRNLTRGVPRNNDGDPIAVIQTGDASDDTSTSSASSTPAHEADSILASEVAAQRYLGARRQRFGSRAESSDMATARALSAPTYQSRQKPSAQYSVPPGYVSVLICWICFIPGHKSTDCPHRHRAMEPEYLDFFKNNWNNLPTWQQEYLKAQGRGYANRQASHDAPPSRRDRSPHHRSASSAAPTALTVTPPAPAIKSPAPAVTTVLQKPSSSAPQGN